MTRNGKDSFERLLSLTCRGDDFFIQLLLSCVPHIAYGLGAFLTGKNQDMIVDIDSWQMLIIT
jgi:hypothetical protein